jgi:plastocyanin
VGAPTQIITQPASVVATAADTVQFTVEATHVYSYQWKYSKNGTVWYTTIAEGNQTSTLTVAAKGHNGYQYRCHLKGLDGTETVTEAATLRLQ